MPACRDEDELRGEALYGRHLTPMQKEGWERQRFNEDFKSSECYARPLNLEETTDGTFLETFFTVQHDHMDFRLKNVNEGEV